MLVSKYKVVLKEQPVNYNAKYSFPTEGLMPADIAVFALNELELAKEAEEYVYALYVDTKLQPVGVSEISHGTNNKSICSTRSIFQRALLLNANSVFLIHNHPTGDVSPSADDVKSTKIVKQAGELLEINLLDHIIVGSNGGYYSFKEHNIL